MSILSCEKQNPRVISRDFKEALKAAQGLYILSWLSGS